MKMSRPKEFELLTLCNSTTYKAGSIPSPTPNHHQTITKTSSHFNFNPQKPSPSPQNHPKNQPPKCISQPPSSSPPSSPASSPSNSPSPSPASMPPTKSQAANTQQLEHPGPTTTSVPARILEDGSSTVQSVLRTRIRVIWIRFLWLWRRIVWGLGRLLSLIWGRGR